MGRDNQQNTEGFSVGESTLHDPMRATCHYTFVQIHRMYNIKNEP